MTQPPSFQPRRRRPRPDADNARPVGRDTSSSDNTPPEVRSDLSPNASSRRTPQRRSVINSASHTAGPVPSQRRPGSPIRRSVLTGGQQAEIEAATPQQASDQMPPSFAPRRRASADSNSAPGSIPPPARPQAPAPRPSTPAPPSGPPPGRPSPRPLMPPARRRPSAKKILGVVALVLVLLLAIPIAWIVHLYNYGQENLNRIDALSGAPDTPGTTYLIVGSDERSDAFPDDPTQGMRADTMMLLHVPESGTTALVSLPRDTFVTFPDDYGQGKLNASMAWGGPKLLVATVENLTGLTVDHYIQIGMEGVIDLTDAVGGINLCLDYDVDDYYSGLVWTAGCHDVDGETALAFARMRYADPLGDIGRTDRQRQVVSQIISEAVSRDTLLSPSKQKNLVGAVSSVLTIDENDSLLDIAKAGFSLRDVMGEGGVSGTPPISDMSYWHNGGSHVLLDPATIDQFWVDLRDGNLTQDSFSSF